MYFFLTFMEVASLTCLLLLLTLLLSLSGFVRLAFFLHVLDLANSVFLASIQTDNL